MKPNKISQNISQLVSQIKGLLEGQFRFVSIEGEVSNLNLSSSGHWYFTLSDRNASVSAALFRGDALRNPKIKSIKDGDKVLITGSVGVYAKRGTFQIIAKTISLAGVGDLKTQFEALKKKLSMEGLFDVEVKKKLPSHPKKVAVITSKGGAALQDFLNIYKRRGIWMDILLSASVVQGNEAPKSLVESLRRVIKYSLINPEKEKVDVIVLTRGGGSLEDLWAFNDEALAWEIFNCPIPIISAVGHQVDFSISDFVSDFRCETPSAAAEILTDGQTKLRLRIQNTFQRFMNSSQLLMAENREALGRLNPRANLERIWNHFFSLQKRLQKCNLKNRFLELTQVHEHQMELDDLEKRMSRYFENLVAGLKNRIEKSDELLHALGPKNVLNRGYTFTTDQDGAVVTDFTSFKRIEKGSVLKLHFSDGHGNVEKI